MGSFTSTRLAGNRALIQGTDNAGVIDKIVVSSAEWDAVKDRQDLAVSHDAFDAAVEEFFAPLTTAAEALSEAHATPPQDANAYVVLEEPVTGRPARGGVVLELSYDSQILRLVEAGDFDRLVWVNGELEILEQTPQAATPQAPADSRGTSFFGR